MIPSRLKTILAACLPIGLAVTGFSANKGQYNTPPEIATGNRTSNELTLPYRSEGAVTPFGEKKFELALPRFQTPPKSLPILKAHFAAGETPVWMYGNVTSTSEPLDEPLIGIYKYQINSTNHNRERVHIDMALRGLYGNAGWTPEGFHIAVADPYTQERIHRLYNTDNWEIIREVNGLDRLHEFNSSAWDWRENRQAALCISDSAWAIHDFAHFENQVNFARTKGFPVMIKNSLLRAIAIDTDGTAFGIDYNGILYEINRPYKYLRVIGNTGLPTPYDTSMYIDPLTHTLYYVCNNQTTGLYTLNTETAQATHVWDFPWKEQIFGLYTYQPLALDGAPAEAKALSLDFAADAMTGNVVFTAPTTTYSGQALAGELDYEVLVDRRKVASGKVTPGAQATATVAPDTTGYHKFNVVFSNSEGRSPYKVEDRWIGLDYVERVKNPVCEYQGANKVKLTWPVCSASQHGGYLPESEVVYDVVCYPGAVEVATGISGNSFEETLELASEGPSAFYYTVCSRVRNLGGTPTESNKIVVGMAEPPYDFPMDTEAHALLFTPIDADGDGYGWEWKNGKFISYYNPYTRADRDDWLVSAPLLVEKGKSYLLTIRICGHDSSCPQTFEIRGGALPQPEALSQVVMPLTTIENDNWSVAEFSSWMTPDVTGEYYVAIRATAPAGEYYLYLHSMNIQAGETAAAPKAPSDFKVYTADEGGTNAFHTLTLPSNAVSGEALGNLSYVSVKRDGTEVYRKENPAPGETIEFKEKLKRTGDYQYTAVAANDAGEGLVASLTAHIGNTTPAQPVGAYAGHAGEGEVLAGWTAPDCNVSGSPINPTFLTYSVSHRDGTLIMGDIRTTETVLPHTSGDQRFEQLYVRAHYPGGQSDPPVYTDPVVLGDPLGLPYTESFAGAEAENAWMSHSLENSGRWGTADDSGEITSVDGDGGFMIYQASYQGAKARLTGGYVTVEASTPASFSCHYYCLEGSQNTFEVQLHDGNGWHTIGTIDCGQGTPEAWNRAEFAIPAEYAGHTVQIGVLGNTENYRQSFLDKIAIDETSGIECLAPDKGGSFFTVSAKANSLTVVPASGTAVHVFTVSGSMIATVRQERTITLPSGLYIVSARGRSVKVML